MFPLSQPSLSLWHLLDFAGAGRCQGRRSRHAVVALTAGAPQRRILSWPKGKTPATTTVLLACLCLSLSACVPLPLVQGQQKQLLQAQLKTQLQAAEPQLRQAGVADRPLDVQMKSTSLFPESDGLQYAPLPQLLLEDGSAMAKEPLRVACKADHQAQVVCKRLQPSTTDYLRSNGSAPLLK